MCDTAMSLTGQTYQSAVLDLDLGGPKEPCVGWEPRSPPRALPGRGTLVGHTWACLNFSAVSILNIICKRAAAMQLFALSTVATFRVIATC